MEDFIAPANNIPFDFEIFVIKELKINLNEKKKPQSEICKYYLKGTCRMGARCQFKHAKNDKTVMCKHWLRALCKKGDNCEFLHEYDLKKMPECWFYSNYKECSNSECMYLHVDPESKRRECLWYDRGFCKHGPHCRNKHVRRVPCQNFLTGFCPLGADCPKGHPKHEIPKYESMGNEAPVLVTKPGFPIPKEDYNKNNEGIHFQELLMEKFYAYIDQHQDYFIGKLKDAVAIPSVSSQPEHRPDVVRMADWLQHEMTRLGVSVTRADAGDQELNGKKLKLPPILLGTYGTDPSKKTVLVYGHYDVQPALLEDGWTSDPWVLTEDSEGRLYGRGSTDDKGPVIAWLWVIEAHQKLGLDLPVNVKMCFEGMEESGSEGLDDLIKREATKYFTGVDCVCISDNYWLGKTKPCLTHGLRGVSYFSLEVVGPAKDLHSGSYGGAIHEPMTDLVHLMSRLVKSDGTILVPGVMDQVAPLTEEEKERYRKLDFSIKDFQESLGAKNTVHDNEMDTLLKRWRYPSLSLHGVEGAFYAPGAKTVIPARVIGKFSIRTVPNMDPDHLTKLVTKYLEQEFVKLGSKNKIKVQCGHAGKWWLSDPNHWNYVAGSNAIEKVFGMKPDFTREGGSIPVTLTFQDELKKNVLLLPIGSCDDGAHSINEKIDRRNYVQGIKLLGTYLHELANVKK